MENDKNTKKRRHKYIPIADKEMLREKNESRRTKYKNICDTNIDGA